MAWLSHADQNQLPMPRFHPGRSSGAGSGSLFGPGAAGGHERHPRVAVLLLQSSHDGSRIVSRARHFHPVNEVEEHAALDARRGPDYTPWARVLRLTDPNARTRLSEKCW